MCVRACVRVCEIYCVCDVTHIRSSVVHLSIHRVELDLLTRERCRWYLRCTRHALAVTIRRLRWLQGDAGVALYHGGHSPVRPGIEPRALQRNVLAHRRVTRPSATDLINWKIWASADRGPWVSGVDGPDRSPPVERHGRRFLSSNG